MDVSIVENVTTEPIDLALVKDFCRIDPDYTGEDATLTLLQASAREMLEKFLSLSLAPKTIAISFGGGHVVLPYGPHTEVVSVSQGDGTILDADKYKVSGMDFKSINAGNVGYEFFYPMFGSRPIVEPIGGSYSGGLKAIVKVGYTAEQLQSGLKHAILKLIDYLYQNRGSKVTDIPKDIFSSAAVYSRNSIL